MIQIVPLGSQGLTTSRQGLGCMGMSEFYGAADDAESVATIHRAIELGVTLLDTADMYGIGRDPADVTIRGLRADPAYVHQACEASLKRLGVEHIDLYYLHRADPRT